MKSFDYHPHGVECPDLPNVILTYTSVPLSPYSLMDGWVVEVCIGSD